MYLLIVITRPLQPDSPKRGESTKSMLRECREGRNGVPAKKSFRYGFGRRSFRPQTPWKVVSRSRIARSFQKPFLKNRFVPKLLVVV